MANQYTMLPTLVTSSAAVILSIPWVSDTVVLTNDGPSPVYLSLGDTASTNTFQLNSGETLNLPGRTKTPSFICSSSSATVRGGFFQW